MIRKILPEETHHFNNDPVRPHISAFFRTTEPNETYIFSFENNIDAIICVAYTNEVPHNEDELKEERDEKQKELAEHMENMNRQAEDALPDPNEE